MLMESDPNPFPKLELISPMTKLSRLAHFLFDHIQSPGLSDHTNHGGGPALDRALYNQPEYENPSSYYFKGQAVTEHPENWGQLTSED